MSIRHYFYKILQVTLLMGLWLALLVVLIIAAVQWYFIPQLPPAERLKEVRLQVPMRVYTKDHAFIAEYGKYRRIPLAVNQIPPLMVKAVLAAEDDRFYDHPGVDLKGLLRAAVRLLKTGEKEQGGSTITMQVARNFFLSPKRTYTRKFKEILLAFKIEEELSKDEILELYLNKIFFGHRAYGVGAAAQVYYGKDIKELSLAEWALLAGLPKAPSTHNPLTNPQEALKRRNYVLERMLKLRYITRPAYEEAVKAPNTAKHHKLIAEVAAFYVAEMVRTFMLDKFGQQAAYTNGYKIFTTIDGRLQKKSQAALRHALFLYDERHGYRGVLDHLSIPDEIEETELHQWAHERLKNYSPQGNLIPSLVLQVQTKKIIAYNREAGEFKIAWQDISWARRYIRENRRGRYPKSARSVVKRGDIIMVRSIPSTQTEKSRKPSQAKQRWRLAQKPQVEGALVALNPNNGAIVSLEGGFDFYESKFNRVIQAARQPGSTFKPFIYSAALARGFSASSMINDAPIVFRVGRKRWRPQNYSHRYYGQTTLRKALTYSHNVAAVRLLQRIGVNRAIDHVTQFGFQRNDIPKNLTIALGTSDTTPLELATGFTVFANGGYRVEPYFIERIEDVDGKIIFSANPLKVCRQCPPEILSSEPKIEGLVISHSDCAPAPRYAPQVISAYNAYVMTSMLKDVIQVGTARRAGKVFNRKDIAGKTGTTNDLRDAWFSGYSPDLVTTVWVGFDQPRSLGHSETGGRTALPMWIEFMKDVLKDKPTQSFPKPRGRIAKRDLSPLDTQASNYTTRISKKRTSKTRRASQRRSSKKKAVTSYQKKRSQNRRSSTNSSPKRSTVIPEQLF